ncbi:RICIN domain-containing protein [Actinoallomurus sp. CA-150999]|uniref:RICIN domain-containing protein n=1 Tax=Actinoallomurus sp. CA-150999 TaxID=3239887 RepID=UPI003D8F35E6
MARKSEWGELRGEWVEYNTLAKALRELTDEHGLSVRRVAERMPGYGKSSVSANLNGERCPDWPFIEAFVKACTGGDDHGRQIHLNAIKPLWEAASASKQPLTPAQSPGDLQFANERSAGLPAAAPADALDTGNQPDISVPDPSTAIGPDAGQPVSRSWRPPKRPMIVLLIALTGAAATAVVMGAVELHGHTFTLGPETSPPIGYGGVARIHSANGLAIDDVQTHTQAGNYPRAAQPNATDSQRWAIWFGTRAGLPDERQALIETYRTDGVAKFAQGAVIDHSPTGTTTLTVNERSPSQRWTFHPADGNWYLITDDQQTCLTAVQGGAPLQVRTCDGGPGQRWKLTDITNGRV